MESSRKIFCAASVQVAQMVEEIIGCKWSVSVMDCVRKGIVRPGAMERSIVGVSTKVLNQRLRIKQVLFCNFVVGIFALRGSL